MSWPPPPPPLPITSLSSSPLSSNKNLEEDVLQTLKKWIEREGLQEVSFIAGWRDVPSVLQNGPQCGLVALCMAAQSLGISITTDKLFGMAVDKKMTKQGEMFSASALAELASCFDLQTTVINSGLSNIKQVLELLTEGKFLLVPYDADRDHRPCLKKGHKAHWAILIGYFMRPKRVSSIEHHCLEQNIYKICGKTNSILCQDLDKSNIYLFAKHGKSKWTAIWNYQHLEDSNLNLEEVDPQRRDEQHYVLPSEAKLTKDLCGKIISITRNSL